jgi:hypothetical protein
MDIHIPATLTSDKQPLINIRWEVGWVLESIWTLQGREEALSVPGSTFDRLVSIQTRPY